MASKFGWVDFADEDRQKMMDVVQLYRDRDTRDELGIGTIRDAFSEYFFPGTSTIQTRVKYMLFVPWIYLDLERKRVPSDKIANRARYAELRLVEALLSNGEQEGVIGSEARRSLQRLPSSIYWSGLYSWGIRLYPGSQDQYHRHLDAYYQRRKIRYDGEADEEFSDPSAAPTWHPGLPECTEDLVYNATLKLNRNEAQYLKERIVLNHSSSFLAKLVQADLYAGSDFPWQSHLLSKLSESDPLKNEVWHARNFSETMHGAALLYNLLLSKARDNSQWVDDYERRFKNWIKLMRSRDFHLRNWHFTLEEFWNLAPFKLYPIPRLTQAFVNDWLKLAFVSPGYEKLMTNQSARRLITEREYHLKRNRARLENKRALEMWRGMSGTQQLSYRWRTVSTFVSDILIAL